MRVRFPPVAPRPVKRRVASCGVVVFSYQPQERALTYPVDFVLHSKSRTLDIVFDDGACFNYTCEFLRVHSPSADVQGHTPAEAKLQVGKRDVGFKSLDPVGSYAVKIAFSDGHDSGLYSWEYLRELGENKEALWEAYLADLAAHGASRDPDDPANLPFKDKPKAACPSRKH
ncbi:MAG: DUF971 domain-containing protein [Duodenibacillus sp.]|nr:DUF971 domain-containing protein [Duodenibacillus sp.]